MVSRQANDAARGNNHFIDSTSGGIRGASHGSWSASPISGPVLGVQDFSIFVQPVHLLEPVNDELPRTVYVTTDFAFTLRRSAARTVQQVLGTSRYRTDAGCMSKNTITTALTLFPPYTLLI